ncbi:MAG: helicase-exonuclease AddAB subunit AddA, partial [Firmicutes bacterium]|nr:helicase-exonuclease AddAB subunit AddA [Bacillota bacterium]
MKWTKEQQQAIDERGKNILVAAAAGSGKTAVLVERIKKLIIEDEVSIDRMLIVTFTNAAATEMKEKIRKALQKEAEEHPEHGPKMRQQLALLARANISTFHAFALEVIRKFFYEADVEPGFSLCDDAQRTILKEEAMDLLMEQWFAKDDDAFYEFLGWYSSDRNQNKIRTMVDQTYNTLMAMPHPWQWLDEKVAELSMNADEFKASSGMEYIWKLVETIMEKTCTMGEKAVELLSEEGLERLSQKVDQEELIFYHEMMDDVERRDWPSLEQHVMGYKAARLVAKKDEKETYEGVKNSVAALRKKASGGVSEIKSLFFAVPLEEQIEEMNQTAPKAEILRQLLLDFDHIFRTSKESKRLVDFNDIEHFCLEILEAGEAATYYQKKFDHIFIDEYQDTNILQEEIVSLIRRKNNLFMVGDIKQSIYKFRLAEPEIFKAKYTAYGSDENSVRIDLNQNFRSKSAILKEINEIFDDVMEDYDEAAMLYPGVDYDGPHNYTPSLHVIDMASVDQEDEELTSLKKVEVEALEVARLIEQNLGKMFYDHKQGVERPLGLRDMVVLMRGTKNYADVFYQTLKSRGIDSFVDESDGYFDTMEISVFMNLLSVIDNKQQDVPLISVLHSEIFKFSSLELSRIRGEQRRGSFANALIHYAEEGSKPALQQKCKAVLSDLQRWKTLALTQPLSDFIWSLMLETGYYVEIGAMPGGSQRQANLRALVDKAEGYMRDRQTSLYRFVRYIDAVKERKVPMGQVKLIGEQDELVRIMTIHKSKGLEFPLVIVSGMGRLLNYTKIGSGVSVHKDIGIGMTLADFGAHWYKQTLLQKLISRQVHYEEVQEETRILYVALTRAKDFLYMTGTVKDGDKYLESLSVDLSGDASYLDMIGETSSWEMI